MASSAQASPLSSGTHACSGTEGTQGGTLGRAERYRVVLGAGGHTAAYSRSPGYPPLRTVRLPVPRCTDRRRGAHSASGHRFVQSSRLRCSRHRPRRRVPPSGRPSAFSRLRPQRSMRRLRHEWPRWLGCGTGPVWLPVPRGASCSARLHCTNPPCGRTRPWLPATASCSHAACRVVAFCLFALVLHGWRVASCAACGRSDAR